MMRKVFKIMFVACVVWGNAASQGNLINNGSFETYSGSCPAGAPNGAFTQVAGWGLPLALPGHGIPHAELYCNGTPNYGLCLPGPAGGSDGDAYVGFHTRNMSPPYNESILQELSATLTPSASPYRISFDLMNCQTGMFTSGPSDFCIYGKTDAQIPACPSDSPSVALLGCVPYDSISSLVWKHHEIDFTLQPGDSINVIAFSGSACFTSEIYYYLDNVVLTSTTSLPGAISPLADIRVGPNPFTDWLQVDMKENAISEYEVWDVAGRIITKGYLYGNEKHMIRFSGNMADGLYSIRIRTSTESRVWKIVRSNG